MTRQTTLLLALGMLIAAALVVSVSGWILLVRDARSARELSFATGGMSSTEADEGS
jgi:hypothetical protein